MEKTAQDPGKGLPSQPLEEPLASGANTHRGAHHVAQAKVEAALLVHGIVQPWELGQGRPVMGEGVITQAVIGAVRGHVGAIRQLRPFLEPSW